MKITYDRDADAANIVFQKGKYHISREIGEGVIVDYSKGGKILSIELLDISRRIPKGSIEKVTSVEKALA